MPNHVFTVTYLTSAGEVSKAVTAQDFRHEPNFTVFADEDDTDVFSVHNDSLLIIDGGSGA